MQKSNHSFNDLMVQLRKLKSEADEGNLPRVLCLHGNSDSTINLAASIIKKVWLGQPSRDYIAMEATELDNDRILEMWEQTSLFDPHPLYLLRRCEKRADFAKLIAKLPDIQGNHLCFLYQTDKIPAPLQKEIERLHGTVLPCLAPLPQEIPAITQKQAEQRGIKLSDKARKLLLDCVGNDLDKLINELEKLSLIYANSNRELSDEEIAPYLGLLREDHAFKLDQLLLQNRYADAHILASSLLDRGESAIAIVGILARHCRNALKIGSALKQNLPTKIIASEMYLPFSMVQNYSQYLRNKNAKTFISALESCRIADINLKSSGIAENLALTKIIDVLSTP